jgi:hypothetical protein
MRIFSAKKSSTTGSYSINNLLIAILLTADLALGTNIKATTEDGRAVILKDDGTWTYAETPKRTGDSPTWTVEDIRASIVSHCTKQWGADVKMRKYCQDHGLESVGKLGARKPLPGMSENDFNVIRQRCLGKWAPSPEKDARWDMVDYCESEQHEAFSKISSR